MPEYEYLNFSTPWQHIQPHIKVITGWEEYYIYLYQFTHTYSNDTYLHQFLHLSHQIISASRRPCNEEERTSNAVKTSARSLTPQTGSACILVTPRFLVGCILPIITCMYRHFLQPLKASCWHPLHPDGTEMEGKANCSEFSVKNWFATYGITK